MAGSVSAHRAKASRESDHAECFFKSALRFRKPFEYLGAHSGRNTLRSLGSCRNLFKMGVLTRLPDKGMQYWFRRNLLVTKEGYHHRVQDLAQPFAKFPHVARLGKRPERRLRGESKPKDQGRLVARDQREGQAVASGKGRKRVCSWTTKRWRHVEGLPIPDCKVAERRRKVLSCFHLDASSTIA